jgi:hypothetical protein
VPAFVAKWKVAQARVDALRASLASARAVVDRQAELDPEDLVEALRLSQDGTTDLSADRKVLRSMGVQITVDSALKQAVIRGSLGQVVAGRLGMPNPQNLWEASG